MNGPGAEAADGDNAAVIEALLEALRVQDHEATAARLDPEIEAKGNKGSFRGIDAVVGWARPSDDGALVSRVEVDEIREVGDLHVAVAARRQWCWRDGGELADEAPFGVLFELRDGRVLHWRQDFDSIIAAIEAIPAS